MAEEPEGEAAVKCPLCSGPMEPVACAHAGKKSKTDYRCACGGYGCTATRLLTPPGAGRPRRFCVHDGNATIVNIYQNEDRSRTVAKLRCVRCKAEFMRELPPEFARTLRALFAEERRKGR